MKCNYCNNEVPDQAKFCPSCGAMLTVSEVVDMPVQPAAPEVVPPQPEIIPQAQPYTYSQVNNNQGSYSQNNYHQNTYGQNAYDQNTNYSQNHYAQPQKQISGTPYMVFAILTTLCCCLPFGIASIVYASKINSLSASGDYAGAEEAAKKARLFAIIGAVGGIVFSVLSVVLANF